MSEDLIEQADDFIVVGIALRTSEETAAEDIPAFWQRFMQEGTAAALPHRSDDASVYAVYCDYESDHRGAYTMVLGVAVDAAAAAPAGTRSVSVPRGRYARFVAEGDPSRVVWETWVHINEAWSRRRERRYLADFERYAPDAMSEGKVRVEVLVGLRP